MIERDRQVVGTVSGIRFKGTGVLKEAAGKPFGAGNREQGGHHLPVWAPWYSGHQRKCSVWEGPQRDWALGAPLASPSATRRQVGGAGVTVPRRLQVRFCGEHSFLVHSCVSVVPQDLAPSGGSICLLSGREFGGDFSRWGRSVSPAVS